MSESVAWPCGPCELGVCSCDHRQGVFTVTGQEACAQRQTTACHSGGFLPGSHDTQSLQESLLCGKWPQGPSQVGWTLPRGRGRPTDPPQAEHREGSTGERKRRHLWWGRPSLAWAPSLPGNYGGACARRVKEVEPLPCSCRLRFRGGAGRR